MTQETDQSLINKSQRLTREIAAMKGQDAGDNSDLSNKKSELRAIKLELKVNQTVDGTRVFLDSHHSYKLRV